MWSALSFGGSRLVIFLMTLALARLLIPQDFGIVASGLVLIGFLEVALDLGFGGAIIYEQEKGITKRIRTAYTLNLLLAAALTGAGILSAPFVAELFRIPDSVDLIRALFCYLFLRGAGQVQAAILQRDLRYRERAVVNIVRACVRATVSVILAVAGNGAWAIAIGLLAGELAGLAAAWVFVPLLPALRLDRSAVRVMLRFSLALLGLKTLGALLANGDDFVVGSRLGPAALGMFVIAARLPELMIDSVHWIVSSVSFSLYAKTRDHGPAAFRDRMLRALRLVTVFGFSTGTGLAIVAPMAIPLLFSEQWKPAIGAAIFIALGMGLGSIGYASGDIFLAVGRPSVMLKLTAMTTACALTGFWIAAAHGIAAVAAVNLIVEAVFSVAILHLGNRLVGSTWREVLSAMRPALASAVGITCTALPVSLLLPPSLPALVATIVAGVVGALLALVVAGRAALEDLAWLIRRGRR
jgi:PST family polysaccharide transporter